MKNDRTLQHLFRFLETDHEARLEFSETADSLRTRLRELSGTAVADESGLISRARLTVQDDELRVMEFGRTRLRGQVDSLADGTSLVLTASAPLLRVGVWLWWFAMAHGAFSLLKGILFGRPDFESLVECFLLASFVGSLLFPSLWGRRWKFHRHAAVLAERLQARNKADLLTTHDETGLARGGAWSSFLSAFVWSPLLAIQRFPLLHSGRQDGTAPWVNWRKFLENSIGVEITLILLMLLFGWMFVAGGAASAWLVVRLSPNLSPTRRRWATTILSLSVSLLLCWFISGSKTLARMFYIP